MNTKNNKKTGAGIVFSECNNCGFDKRQLGKQIFGKIKFWDNLMSPHEIIFWKSKNKVFKYVNYCIEEVHSSSVKK